MNLIEKIKILSDSAKYDVSCSSSGSDRKNKKGGIGNAAPSGICHSWTPDGRCISLLKILFTNSCIYDCKYCINRFSNDVLRASFTPDELVNPMIFLRSWGLYQLMLYRILFFTTTTEEKQYKYKKNKKYRIIFFGFSMVIISALGHFHISSVHKNTSITLVNI